MTKKKKGIQFSDIMIIPLMWIIFRVLVTILLAYGYISTSNQDFLIALGFFMVIIWLEDIRSKMNKPTPVLKDLDWIKEVTT